MQIDAHEPLLLCAHMCVLFASCLATKVFIGNLLGVGHHKVGQR